MFVQTLSHSSSSVHTNRLTCTVGAVWHRHIKLPVRLPARSHTATRGADPAVFVRAQRAHALH